MTTKQKEIVDSVLEGKELHTLSGPEFFKVYGSLYRRDLEVAKALLSEWEEKRPGLSEQLKEKQEQEEYVNVWEMAQKMRVERPPDHMKQDQDDGMEFPPGHEIEEHVKRHFEKSDMKDQVRLVFRILSDGKIHSRQELLHAIHEEGWGEDYEFRKHVSDVRDHLAAVSSKYVIPKNKTDKRGYGLYQIRLKQKYER